MLSSRLRRSFVLVCTLAIAAATLAPSASAASAVISLKPKTGPPTTIVNVTGSGFGASETVDITFDSVSIASGATDPTGAFTANFTVPPAATPGSHQVMATGQTSTLVATADFLRTDWSLSFQQPPYRVQPVRERALVLQRLWP